MQACCWSCADGCGCLSLVPLMASFLLSHGNLKLRGRRVPPQPFSPGAPKAFTEPARGAVFACLKVFNVDAAESRGGPRMRSHASTQACRR